MLPTHHQDIDQFWAAEMAMPAGFLPTSQQVVCVAQHQYSGVQFLLRDDWLVIAAPSHRVEPIAHGVRGMSVCDVFSVEFVGRLLSPEVGTIIGPAHVSYADVSIFHASSTAGSRRLTPADAAIRQSLVSALSPTEMEHSGVDPHEAPAFGVFADGVLCAMASYDLWKPRIAHVTVTTHPDYRRHGHGRAAVSALAEHAFAKGLALQYRALAANTGSLALGHALGFKHCCSTIYARPAGA